MPELLDAIEIEPERTDGKRHLAARLGADGNDSRRSCPSFDCPRRDPLRFSACAGPAGDDQRRHANARVYDITDGANRHEDERGVRASQVLIEALIGGKRSEGRKRGGWCLRDFRKAARSRCTPAAPSRAHRRNHGLSTYVPVGEKLSAEASTANRDVPIFMGHGSDDPIIPLVRGEQSETC